MARSEARISVDIWDDPDFLALSSDAQRTYMFLLSQADLAHTGVIALRERRWSRKVAGGTVDQITASLNELSAARFVVVDEDAEELLVRSLIRRDKVYRQPNVLRNARDQLALVSSPSIRQAIGAELRRIAGEEMPEVSRELIQAMLDDIGEPGPNPSGNPSGNPSDNPSAPDTAILDYSDVGHGDLDVSAGDNPSGNPSGNPSWKGSENPTRRVPGERGGVRRVSSDSPIPVPRTVPPPAGDDAPPAPSAQTLIGEWIDHCTHRPPKQVIGQASKQVKALLDEGIDYEAVRSGLAQWHAKGLHPSAIPSVVNEVLNASPHASRASPSNGSRPSTTDQRVADTLALGQRLQARLDQQQQLEIGS